MESKKGAGHRASVFRPGLSVNLKGGAVPFAKSLLYNSEPAVLRGCEAQKWVVYACVSSGISFPGPGEWGFRVEGLGFRGVYEKQIDT